VTASEGSPGPPAARAWWKVIEPIHAVTYFAPESHQALRASGLRGFWMGYFAARVAPVGAVGPSTVSATFFNFHPAMVRRSIPDAWTFADPSTVLAARRTGAAAALRRLDPTIEDRARALAPRLGRAVDAADGSGRVLFSANRALDGVDEPVEALWQLCTSLREHRGDGHVAALTAAGLNGGQALVLFAVSEDLPTPMFLDSRGWSADEWEVARRDLEDRGLVDGSRITAEGAALRRSVEETTDRLAAPPYDELDHQEAADVFDQLLALSGAVATGGEIPYPNPMGLPAPGPD
jgi:hypothetical protein